MKLNKIEVLKGKKNYWYWKIVWCNGKIGIVSEMYSSKSKAKKSAIRLYSYLPTKTWELKVEGDK